ncbi:MAG: glycosyltransferase [Pseudomonadota bacterium]
MAQAGVDLSVVIPVKNESENVGPLLTEIRAALDAMSEDERPAYEVIFVDDGSDDGTGDALKAAGAGFGGLRVLRHETSCGQSTAIHSGVRCARGAWIATLDGDGQNDPADIPDLWRENVAAHGRSEGSGPQMVAGVRRKRKDTAAKRYASRFANGLRRRLLRDDSRDTGCGLKLFSREVFLSLPYFDHMHRYLPALFKRHGARVVEREVNHRPRHAGSSKYTNFQRALVGITDLMGVMWLQRRTRLPDEIKEVI